MADLEGGNGTTVTIPPGGTATIQLTDKYETGELVINKTITGAAAGLQGQVVIHTVCNGTALTARLLDRRRQARAAPTTTPTAGILAGATLHGDRDL